MLGLKRSGILVHVSVNKPQRFVNLSLLRSVLLCFCSVFHTFSFTAAVCPAAGKGSLGSWADKTFCLVGLVQWWFCSLNQVHFTVRQGAALAGWDGNCMTWGVAELHLSWFILKLHQWSTVVALLTRWCDLRYKLPFIFWTKVVGLTFQVSPFLLIEHFACLWYYINLVLFRLVPAS